MQAKPLDLSGLYGGYSPSRIDVPNPRSVQDDRPCILPGSSAKGVSAEATIPSGVMLAPAVFLGADFAFDLDLKGGMFSAYVGVGGLVGETYRGGVDSSVSLSSANAASSGVSLDAGIRTTAAVGVGGAIPGLGVGVTSYDSFFGNDAPAAVSAGGVRGAGGSVTVGVSLTMPIPFTVGGCGK